MRISGADKAAFKVQAGIRADLLAGAYPPGRSIVIQEEAARFGVSQTPVREALAWLAGEGLIEHTPLEGWRTFELAPSELSDLYELHHICAQFAGSRVGPEYAKGLPDFPWRPDLRGWGVFDDVMERAAQGAVLRVYRTVRDQLQWLRGLEHTLLKDQVQERHVMVAAENGDWQAYAELTRAYHHRRQERVNEIALMARRWSADD